MNQPFCSAYPAVGVELYSWHSLSCQDRLQLTLQWLYIYIYVRTHYVDYAQRAKPFVLKDKETRILYTTGRSRKHSMIVEQLLYDDEQLDNDTEVEESTTLPPTPLSDFIQPLQKHKNSRRYMLSCSLHGCLINKLIVLFCTMSSILIYFAFRARPDHYITKWSAALFIKCFMKCSDGFNAVVCFDMSKQLQTTWSAYVSKWSNSIIAIICCW